MKKFVYFLLVMFLGLQCQAVENFSLELAPTIPIDGNVKSRGNKDVIIVNVEPPKSEMYKMIFEESSTSNSSTSSNSRIASSQTPRQVFTSDPYIIQVNGTSYIMIKDNPAKKWDKGDIIGIDDTKETLFAGLKSLESDGDRSKLTYNELKRANIRFAKIDNNGAILVNDKKQDYSLDNINYIDMKNLKKLANSSVTGIFGHFNVYLKTDNNSSKVIIGYVTLHEDNDEPILFK